VFIDNLIAGQAQGESAPWLPSRNGSSAHPDTTYRAIPTPTQESKAGGYTLRVEHLVPGKQSQRQIDTVMHGQRNLTVPGVPIKSGGVAWN